MKPFPLILLTAALSFAADDWMRSGKDHSFPQAAYFVGVGISDESMDAARRNAVVEVRKQVSVSISATMLDEQSSVIVGKKEKHSSRTDSRTRLSTSGDVQGIEVVKTGRQDGAFHALAVLNKQKFTALCRGGITEAQAEITALVEDARADIERGRTGSALNKLSAAEGTVVKLLDLRKLLSAASTVTEADGLPSEHTDIGRLYDACIASLRMSVKSGGGQLCAVGAPVDPFVVTVTANGRPAQGIPVTLTDARKTVVQKGVTSQDGTVSLAPNAGGSLLSVGKYAYTVSLALTVSPALSKILAAQSRSFSFSVISLPGFARLSFSFDRNIRNARKEIERKVTAALSQFDIRHDPRAESELAIAVSAAETGSVSGLSKKSGRVSAELSLALSLTDEEGRETITLNGTGKGFGRSLPKAAADAADKVSFDKGIGELLAQLREQAADASLPKQRIAVFEFKNRDEKSGNWKVAAQTLSDKLITELLATGRVELVERSQLDKIMAEKMMMASGLMEDDDESAAEFGRGEEYESVQTAKLAGADLVLLGSGALEGDTLDLDARVVATKNGVARCAMKARDRSVNLQALAKELVGQVRGKCLR